MSWSTHRAQHRRGRCWASVKWWDLVRLLIALFGEEGFFFSLAEGFKHIIALTIIAWFLHPSSGALRWTLHAHYHREAFLSSCQGRQQGSSTGLVLDENSWLFGPACLTSNDHLEEEGRTAHFLEPVRHPVGEFFMAAAQEIWISSRVLPAPSPSLPSSLWAGRSLEMDSFWGIVPQFCKWTPDPCGCSNATKQYPPWFWSGSGPGSGVVPPCSLAGSWPGTMLLPVCTMRGWQMSTSAKSTHPKMAEGKAQEISYFCSCRAVSVKLEICACFLFFSNAWLWPRISYRHSNLVRLMALVSASWQMPRLPDTWL